MQDGISSQFIVNDAMWCCKTTKDPCIREESYPYNVICNGTALSLSDQCHNEDYDGPSCNYYPLDDTRKFEEIDRSYLDLCKDGYVFTKLQSRFYKAFYHIMFSF